MFYYDGYTVATIRPVIADVKVCVGQFGPEISLHEERPDGGRVSTTCIVNKEECVESGL